MAKLRTYRLHDHNQNTPTKCDLSRPEALFTPTFATPHAYTTEISVKVITTSQPNSCPVVRSLCTAPVSKQPGPPFPMLIEAPGSSAAASREPKMAPVIYTAVQPLLNKIRPGSDDAVMCVSHRRCSEKRFVESEAHVGILPPWHQTTLHPESLSTKHTMIKLLG